jgi:hypothetical protein
MNYARGFIFHAESHRANSDRYFILFHSNETGLVIRYRHAETTRLSSKLRYNFVFLIDCINLLKFTGYITYHQV